MTDVFEAGIGHVGIKPPPFYRKNPESWFRQMESQFVLAKITVSETKFHHVMTVLPEDLVSEILTDEVTTYETLKSAIIEHLKANKHQLIEHALSALELGDKRPSQLVSEIKRRFNEIGLKADDTIIKSRLLTALPVHLRSALVGHEDTAVDQYAKIADSMVAVAVPQSPFINAVSTEFRQNSSQPFANRSDRKFTVRPFYPDQKPRICNAHIFYGTRARSCRRWCQWPSKRPNQVLNDHQKTPHQSRSSSPTN